MSDLNVSFLGLGVMGFPMAGHLANAGYKVTVYNRTASKAEQWLAAYPAAANTSAANTSAANTSAANTSAIAKTPEEAAEGADIVFMCVGDDNDVREIGTRALSRMKSDAVLVDHTTASADIARELDAACRKQKVHFLDAPVSGGQAGAENGQLTIMVGGEEASFHRIQPVIKNYARHSQLLGKCGSGQLAKMMNQICIAGIVQGLSEALHFGQKAGLDCNAVIDVISKGAAQSWQMENRASTMLSNTYDFGFAVDWMRKDLGIALDEAKRNGSTLALTALVDQYYADVQKLGGSRWDTSSLLTRLK